MLTGDNQSLTTNNQALTGDNQTNTSLSCLHTLLLFTIEDIRFEQMKERDAE